MYESQFKVIEVALICQDKKGQLDTKMRARLIQRSTDINRIPFHCIEYAISARPCCGQMHEHREDCPAMK